LLENRRISRPRQKGKTEMGEENTQQGGGGMKKDEVILAILEGFLHTAQVITFGLALFLIVLLIRGCC
jgi:hypothetical protein